MNIYEQQAQEMAGKLATKLTNRFGEAMCQTRDDEIETILRELNLASLLEDKANVAKWKAMAQEVISKFKHNHVNNGIDDACKQCGFDLRHEIHIRFNSINKCHHGIRDTATNLPYCRKCDEEGLK